MALDGEVELFGGHSSAVVTDANEASSAAVEDDIDAAGPGVDGIFGKFLDDARRPFDHLAGGNAIGDPVGKPANPHAWEFSAKRL